MYIVGKKVVQYWKKFGGPSLGRVAYIIQGRNCVFTGLDRVDASTINYAEDVIRAICEAEKRWEPFSLTYFDLQTHLGYVKLPGTYQFDRLDIRGSEGQLHVDRWEPAELMKDEAEIFSEEIGDPASWFRVLTVAEAKALRFMIWVAHFNDEAPALVAAANETRHPANSGSVFTVVDNAGNRPHLKASHGKPYTLWIKTIFPDKLVRMP